MKKKDIVLSILSGILLVFGFPPFDFFFISWIALVPLLMALWEKDLKSSFSLGTLTGFVYFAGTTYWVFNSVYFYGNIPAVVSLLIVIALCLYLAIYVGLFSILFTSLCRHSRYPALFTVPVLWVTLEFLRTYLFTGFPWSVLGYSQYKFLQVIQIADITGVLGISFLVAAFNGAVFDVVAYWPNRWKKMPLFDRWPVAVGLITLALCFLLTFLYGIWRLHDHEEGRALQVSIIQGNFEQEKKWDINFKREIINTYKRLTAEASKKSPNLVIWPESAIPFVFGKDKSLTSEIIDFQKTQGSYLLFGGMMERGVKNGRSELSNSGILMSPGGEVIDSYDKIHLVPFGEYVPLRKYISFIGKLVIDIGDFKQGEKYSVLDSPVAKMSSPICFEIIFPGLVRKFVNNGAELIATITNDAWFGRSSAPYQHFSMAVFRAVENRVPVVRAANTGISGFIDQRGNILKKSDIFKETLLTGEITIGSFQESFYSKYGDLFAFLCIINTILLVANNLYPKK